MLNAWFIQKSGIRRTKRIDNLQTYFGITKFVIMPVFQESCAEQIQAQTIIIIHPGSMYLRIGRASDLNPCTMLNAVARKRLPGGMEYKDSLLPPAVPR